MECKGLKQCMRNYESSVTLTGFILILIILFSKVPFLVFKACTVISQIFLRITFILPDMVIINGQNLVGTKINEQKGNLISTLFNLTFTLYLIYKVAYIMCLFFGYTCCLLPNVTLISNFCDLYRSTGILVIQYLFLY